MRLKEVTSLSDITYSSKAELGPKSRSARLLPSKQYYEKRTLEEPPNIIAVQVEAKAGLIQGRDLC